MRDDIQDTAHALGIILRAWVGDHFYLLDAGGGHAFQHLLRIVRHHLVGLVVHIDLERAAAVHLDVVLAVHRHHRYLAEHIENGVRLRVGIVLNVVGDLVDVRLDERLLLHDLHALQFHRLVDAVGTQGVALRRAETVCLGSGCGEYTVK